MYFIVNAPYSRLLLRKSALYFQPLIADITRQKPDAISQMKAISVVYSILKGVIV